MDDPMKIDLAIIAKDLKLSPEKVEKTVELLDAGNTIPFITRFRKDLTGGLDEQQILSIKQRVAQLRALTERKSFVLKSIDSQSKLTDELKIQINKSTSSRRLEDLYLPFKPKKQSRSSLARQQGLEPLADDIFNGVSPDVDVATRATEFVRVDKGLTSVDDVIKGVRDLIAERLSENDELRSTLRKIMWNEGKLASVAVETTAVEEASEVPSGAEPKSDDGGSEPKKPEAAASVETIQSQLSKATTEGDVAKPKLPLAKDVTTETATSETATSETATSETATSETATSETATSETATKGEVAVEKVATEKVDVAKAADGNVADPASAKVASAESEVEKSVSETSPTNETLGGDAPVADAKPADAKPADAKPADAKPADAKPADSSAAAPAAKSKKKKKKKKKPTENPFKDYADFKQSLKQIPNHRVLALNRGARAGSLKVKIELDSNKLSEVSNSALVPAEHPFKEFIEKCANDAVTRMVVPSLEREIRRELTEAAEKHAVEVFANNLRNLLLQPPVRNRAVLAIDPGFKRGCSVAVLDPCGNLLDSGHVFVVGNQTRRDESKQKISDWVKQHKVDVIAIGNGAACRQTEQMVSDTIAEQLQDLKTTYAMVNEAGASIYSTSEIGREELPDLSPSIRSAASIGRRLQDPLSELVKISPANIGVGMYQHDVKAKHLSESLDEVVRFCVNRVGVDVNMASPSLLKYVSGLNSLTARRVVEHRSANGQFKNRDELKAVNGFGDATFVQSAGFLRIHNGDTPLDCTPIHPESYDIATDMLDQIGVQVEAFFPAQTGPKPLGSGANNNEPVSASAPIATDPASSSVDTVPLPSDSVADAESKTVEVASSVVATPDSTQEAVVALESKGDSTAKPESTESNSTVDMKAGVDEVVADASSDESPAAATPVEATPDSQAAPQIAEAPPTKGIATESADRKENLRKISELDVEAIATKHSAGMLLVKDIVMALKRPKWDPRDKVSKPIFRRGIIKADDLKPEMQLDGQVVNVVDFGVFVDIGLGESSLVHVSQLSNHFIRDPHRLFSIGDVVKVWVSEIDSERRRVKLTAIRPGSKKPQNRRPRGGRPQRSATAAAGKKEAGPAKEAGSSGDRSSRSNYKPGKFGSGPKGSSGQRSGGQRSYNKEAPRRSHVRRPSKPKKIKPITDRMLKGDEPMRSFSDLAQFVNKKPEDATDNKGKDVKNEKGTDSSS